MKKSILILILIASTSCKNPFQKNQGSSGGGGSSSVPSAEQMNSFLDSQMKVEIPKCSNISLDEHLEKRDFPIVKDAKYPWPDSYSKAISDQFKKPYMENLRTVKIREDDLKEIGCPGLNYASEDEKRKFWILWLSAIAKPENNFNSKTCYHETDGTDSCGLLQIDYAAANRWCGLLAVEMNKVSKNSKGETVPKFTKEDMLDPEINLKCGLMMMDSQLHGGSKLSLTDERPPKLKRLKKTRTDLEGSLFADPAWYWRVLMNNQKKLEVINWFKVHANRQLPFCKRTNYQIELDGKTFDLSTEEKLVSKTNVGNCDSYSSKKNREICERKKGEDDEEDVTEAPGATGNDINLGEAQTTKEESCDIVNDNSRDLVPPKKGHDSSVSDDNQSSITK